MPDPLSVAGSAVGILSLGIAVAQGLYDYYLALLLFTFWFFSVVCSVRGYSAR